MVLSVQLEERAWHQAAGKAAAAQQPYIGPHNRIGAS
jgi:hypothetical protein